MTYGYALAGGLMLSLDWIEDVVNEGRLTREGRTGLRDAARYFVQAYGDIVDDYRAKRI